jgi:hypothetical protein
MLRARLPCSHSCIAEWLLLQGGHSRLPNLFLAPAAVAATATAAAAAAAAAGADYSAAAAAGPGAEGPAAYLAAAAAFVERWSAPARYCGLNALEKVGGAL